MSVKQRGLPSQKKMRHSAHYIDDLLGMNNTSVDVDFKIIPLTKIRPASNQPRKHMGDIENLAKSLQDKGVLEPIIVFKTEDGQFEIISGERRYRAAQIAKLDSIPCIVKTTTDKEQMEIALIENLQRQDLNPFEEAYGFNYLLEKYNYTHEKIGEIVGKGRTSITETLSLLKMPEHIQNLCVENNIFQKSILVEIMRLPSEIEMEKYIELIKEGATRQELRDLKNKKTKTSPKKSNFVFKIKSKDLPFSLSMKFKKEKVEKEEIVEALEKLIEKIKEEL